MKIRLILCCLLLTACTKVTEVNPATLSLDGNEINPTQIDVKQILGDDKRVTISINDSQSIHDVVQFFNESEFIYQRSYMELPYYENLIGGMFYEVRFSDDNNHFINLKAYEDEMSKDKPGYILCINDQPICKEFYPKRDLNEIIEKSGGEKQEYFYNKNKLRSKMNAQNSLSLCNNTGYPIDDLSQMLAVFNESFTDVNQLSDSRVAVDALFTFMDWNLQKGKYYQVVNEIAIHHPTREIFENHGMSEDFIFYTYADIENKGKALFETYTLPKFNDDFMWENENYIFYVDNEHQGLKGIIKPTPKINQILIPIDYTETVSEKTATFVRAYAYKNINTGTSYLLNAEGIIIDVIQNDSDYYDYVYDRLAQFDVLKLDYTNDKMKSVEILNQVDEKKFQAPLKLADISFGENTFGKKVIQFHHQNLDGKFFDDATIDDDDKIVIHENDQFISIKNMSEKRYKNVTSYLYDKKTGDNLSLAELNQIYDGKLEQIIHDKTSKIVKEVCPVSYEASLKVERCFVPLIIDNKKPSEALYDDIADNVFFINEAGKLGVNLVIRERGTRVEDLFVELD